MDDHYQRRRQDEQPYAAPDPRFMPDHEPSRSFSGTPSQRYRPAPLQSPLPGRGDGGTMPYSGYYQEPTAPFASAMPTAALPYQASYSQESRPPPTFSGYHAADMMYHVAPQTPQGAVYDSNQQFQGARQPAAMHLLPDVAAPFFATEQQSNAPGPSPLQHHAASNAAANVFPPHQPSPVPRAPLLPPGYDPNLSMSGMAPAPSDIMDDEGYPATQAQTQPQAQAPSQRAPMEVAYTRYLSALKEVFQHIVEGRLKEASESLLGVSDWLLTHVIELGLTVDDASLHADRIRLWTEFNAAWLAIFQKQIDTLESRQHVPPPPMLMSLAEIKNMGDYLVKMCDAVEKHGLVDYQYGVEEERIMQVLGECYDLQELVESSQGSGQSQGMHLGQAPP